MNRDCAAAATRDVPRRRASRRRYVNFERMVLEPFLRYDQQLYSADVLMHVNVADRITNDRTREVDQALPGPMASGPGGNQSSFKVLWAPLTKYLRRVERACS